jgi:hypothetical protein
MTKEEMIEWLENKIKNGIKHSYTKEDMMVKSMDLLASLKGYKTQCCSRQGKQMRDDRLNKIKRKSLPSDGVQFKKGS